MVGYTCIRKILWRYQTSLLSHVNELNSNKIIKEVRNCTTLSPGPPLPLAFVDNSCWRVDTRAKYVSCLFLDFFIVGKSQEANIISHSKLFSTLMSAYSLKYLSVLDIEFSMPDLADQPDHVFHYNIRRSC